MLPWNNTGAPNAAPATGDASDVGPSAVDAAAEAFPQLGDVVAQYGPKALRDYPEVVALVAAGLAAWKYSPQFRRAVQGVLNRAKRGGR